MHIHVCLGCSLAFFTWGTHNTPLASPGALRAHMAAAPLPYRCCCFSARVFGRERGGSLITWGTASRYQVGGRLQHDRLAMTLGFMTQQRTLTGTTVGARQYLPQNLGKYDASSPLAFEQVLNIRTKGRKVGASELRKAHYTEG